MLIPYNTDAPVYYWPYVTVGTIVVDVVVFVLEVTCFTPELMEMLMLKFGDGLHPVQWLTTNFLHAGIFHLLGNMIFLWVFGLIVEGKLGPWRTALLYLGTGIFYGAVTQFILRNGEPGYALGASALVYALMAISLIWAPANTIDCLLIVWLRPFFFEMPIPGMVALFLGVDVIILVLSDMAVSTEFLHTMGALVGFAVGIVCVKSGFVDCENWDVFSILQGRHTMNDQERAAIDAQKPREKKKRAQREKKRQEKAAIRQETLLEEMRLAVAQGKPLAALGISRILVRESPGWTLPESESVLLIRSLLEQKLWDEAIPQMRHYLEHYDTKAIWVRSLLAQTLVKTKRPHAALKVISEIDTNGVTATQLEQLRTLHKIAVKTAREMDASGDYELSEKH